MDRNKERLIEIRSEFRSLAARVPEITEGASRSWFPTAARFIISLEQGLPALPPETQEHIGPLLSRGRRVLREEVIFSRNHPGIEVTDELRGLRAEMQLMNISRDMALPYEPEVRPIHENVVSVDELLSQCPDQFRLTTQSQKNNEFSMFGVRHPFTGEWYDFHMPLTDTMWHKGGAARMVMDIYAGSPSSMIASEIPVNDFDVVFVGDEVEAREHASKMRVDPDGVEVAGEEVFDFTKFCYGRDTTQNQICFGNDGLHFSDAALKSAKTGHIDIVGQYIANKAIYGVDQFRSQGVELVKPRGLMRLIKAVSEGKAISFGYKPLNQNLDVGLYWIFLAKKWSKRDDFGILMQRMYELGRRMHQTNPGENSIQDALRRAHKDFPFFDVDRQITDIVDVVRWKSRKFAKQLDREFSWTYNIPANIQYTRSPSDSTPQRISLDGFFSSQDEAERIKKWWPIFAEECRVRTAAYDKLGVNPVERMFFDVDTELPPEGVEE